MMGQFVSWLKDMFDSLSDGEYWHIPADDILFRIDKSQKELVLVMGNTDAFSYARIEEAIAGTGYKLRTSKEDMSWFVP